MGCHRGQHQHDGLQRFVLDRPATFGIILKLVDGIEQFHGGRDRRIEAAAAPDVIADLGDGLVRLAAQRFLRVIEGGRIQGSDRTAGRVFDNGIPEALEEAIAALHAVVGPFE